MQQIQLNDHFYQQNKSNIILDFAPQFLERIQDLKFFRAFDFPKEWMTETVKYILVICRLDC